MGMAASFKGSDDDGGNGLFRNVRLKGLHALLEVQCMVHIVYMCKKAPLCCYSY